jgi:hypothetical protein
VNAGQIIRIAFLLMVIFAAGVLTGRWSVARPPTQVLMAGGRIATADTVLVRLTAEVGLDARQQGQFRPVLEELAEKLSRVPPASRERRDLFNSYVPRFRALLHPNQVQSFDRYVTETNRRFDRLIRRRNGADTGTQP